VIERLRLSVGASRAQRAFGVVFGLVFAAIGTAFVLLPFVADGMLRRLTGADDGCAGASGDVSELPPELLPPGFSQCLTRSGWWDDGIGLGPIRFLGLCGLPFALLGLYLVLNVLRSAAWLDGTTAEVRGAFRTRAVDLATAAVSAGSYAVRRGEDSGHEYIERVPTIVAQDPGNGRRVTIALRAGTGGTLPPYELRALADAMTLGRSTDGRNGDVHTLAGQLRTMADNPLGL
jgi:hypothetical protein